MGLRSFTQIHPSFASLPSMRFLRFLRFVLWKLFFIPLRSSPPSSPSPLKNTNSSAFFPFGSFGPFDAHFTSPSHLLFAPSLPSSPSTYIFPRPPLLFAPFASFVPFVTHFPSPAPPLRLLRFLRPLRPAKCISPHLAALFASDLQYMHGMAGIAMQARSDLDPGWGLQHRSAGSLGLLQYPLPRQSSHSVYALALHRIYQILRGAAMKHRIYQILRDSRLQ